jgi:hypothetical protein
LIFDDAEEESTLGGRKGYILVAVYGKREALMPFTNSPQGGQRVGVQLRHRLAHNSHSGGATKQDCTCFSVLSSDWCASEDVVENWQRFWVRVRRHNCLQALYVDEFGAKISSFAAVRHHLRTPLGINLDLESAKFHKMKKGLESHIGSSDH